MDAEMTTRLWIEYARHGWHTGWPRQAVRVLSGIDDDQDTGEGGVMRRPVIAGLSAEQLHDHHAQHL